MSTFTDSLTKYIKKAKGDTHKVIRTVVIDMADSVVAMSPVGKRELWAANIIRKSRGLPLVPKGYVGGRFRANWMLGVNSVPNGTVDVIDRTGDVSRQRVQAGLPKDAAGHVYYVMNNLPYAKALEEGHSGQAPTGMVANTMTRFQQIFENAVAKTKGSS